MADNTQRAFLGSVIKRVILPKATRKNLQPLWAWFAPDEKL